MEQQQQQEQQENHNINQQQMQQYSQNQNMNVNLIDVNLSNAMNDDQLFPVNALQQENSNIPLL